MDKEIILRIKHAKMNFTYVEEQIAEYFLLNKPCKQINELSLELNVSPASITRFCKKVGLNNYKELVYLYSEHLKSIGEEAVRNIATDFHNSYTKIFNETDANFDHEKIDKVCEEIHNTRLIHIFALGLSATAAQDFKFRFSRMGKFIEVIYDKSAIEMTCSILDKGDLVFFFTLRGNKSLEKYASVLKDRGVTIITITGNSESTLLQNSNVTLLTANLSGEESTGMISAQIPILLQIDLIHYHYVRKYNEVLDKWVSTEKVFCKD